jgi:DnaJ-domain-containing protein 1
MDFNKKINDLAAEVFKRENDRSSAVEIKYAKVCDEQAKKLAIIKRDKLEHMKKLKTEIVEWNAHILSKNRL